MKTKKIALSVYVIVTIFSVIGKVLNNELLMLLSIPAVIPAIFFYYVSAKKQHGINPYLVLILTLNFVGDTLVLLGIEDTKIIMVPYFISYVLLFRFALFDLKKLRFEKMGMLLSIFIFSFLMYIMYALIQLFVDTNQELVIPVIVYGIVLGSLASFAAYSYYIQNSMASFYLAIAVLVSIVSDVFYIMFSLIFHFPSFNYFEFSVQMISYFFIVRFFVYSKYKRSNQQVKKGGLA